MISLNDIITGNQTVLLLHESDTSLALSLLDTQTGEVMRVDIGADMAVLPDQALLSISVTDVPIVDLFRDWNMRGDTFTDDAWPMVNDPNELEPLPTWTITPDGQEIDLRVREGGLF